MVDGLVGHQEKVSRLCVSLAHLPQHASPTGEPYQEQRASIGWEVSHSRISWLGFAGGILRPSNDVGVLVDGALVEADRAPERGDDTGAHGDRVVSARQHPSLSIAPRGRSRGSTADRGRPDCAARAIGSARHGCRADAGSGATPVALRPGAPSLSAAKRRQPILHREGSSAPATAIVAGISSGVRLGSIILVDPAANAGAGVPVRAPAPAPAPPGRGLGISAASASQAETMSLPASGASSIWSNPSRCTAPGRPPVSGGEGRIAAGGAGACAGRRPPAGSCGAA